MNDTREQKIQEIASRLQQYSWDWSGTLRMTAIPSDRQALTIFDQWVSGMRRLDGGPSFRFFRVLERGIAGGNRHFHILIGGLRNRRRYWQQKWNDLGGDALITRYDPDKKGILYMLKGMDEDGYLNFDCDLPSDEAQPVPKTVQHKGDSSPAVLRVDDIDDAVSPAELKKLLKRFGKVLEVTIVDTRINNERNLISVNVTMQDAIRAEGAVDELDGMELRGRLLRVSLAGCNW